MPGWGTNFWKQEFGRCNVRIANELFNYFTGALSDCIASICKYYQLYYFLFYKDMKKVEKDSGPGIYIFFDLQLQDIKYIGTTEKCLRTRILKHENYKNDSIIFIGCRNINQARMRDIEKALILLIKPKRNKIAYIRGRDNR